MANEPRRPYILVVDDDVDICHNMSDILADLGCAVELAHDGEAALERIRRRLFDVALLDLRMPGMDGLTLYRETKKVRAGTVGVLVSAYAVGPTVEEAQASGIWRVVPKPVDFGRIRSLIEEALGQPLLLVVDDDRNLCLSLWDLFRERGYRVCLAHDVAEAMDRLHGTTYRAVLERLAVGLRTRPL